MELYIKTTGDPNFDSVEVHTRDEVKQLITQIETILFTNKGEVLGNSDFGCSLNDMLYSLNANEFTIKNEIDRQLTAHCPLAAKYRVEANITFVRGEVRDEAFIDITINNKYTVTVSTV